MSNPTKIGIVICDRYRRCAGGKCLRALNNREGAFSRYEGQDVQLVGYTTCAGCPGGNVEYLGDEMVKNGVQVIHLATGLLVGYPPCPHIETFKKFLEGRYGIEVVVGTHPIPQNYFTTHTSLGSWDGEKWLTVLAPTMADEAVRKAYD
ncbi:MAG: CGGC domain-containing protein [Pseudodesulfovibrio sp.]|uniref:CGGC domain-containing protein n=1 Tax=Pseudodesulfovibrio sp. TaxID=2035812 RepID=UPI003D1534C6